MYVSILLSAGGAFAAPAAMDQLALQAPRQEAAAAPVPKAGEVAAVIAEKGQPARTIYFEADKGNPIIDAIFGGGNNGNNGGNNGWNNNGNNNWNNGNNGWNNGYNPYPRVNCVASDSGWEEHWGGHGGGPSEMRACRECLSEHGNCRYSCSTEQFRCVAQFTPAAQPGQPQGPVSTYPGDTRQDEGSARDSATLRCMQSTQGQQGYCSIQTCDRATQVVSSGRCRK